MAFVLVVVPIVVGAAAAVAGGIAFYLRRKRGAATAAEMRFVPEARKTAVAARKTAEDSETKTAEVPELESLLAAEHEALRLEQEARAHVAPLAPLEHIQQKLDDLTVVVVAAGVDIAAAREAAEIRAVSIEMRSRVAIAAAKKAAAEAVRQGEVAKRVEDEVLAVTERTASEVALARQAEVGARTAVDAATREAEALRAELARLRAQQAARDAHHRKQMEEEAALWAAELRHMEAIGFDVSHYNIAVAGPAGTGKSTFINSMRGLFSDDPGAATVGTGAQTTTESARFPMPGADHIVFWDEPGGDTLDFPAATYFERRCLRHFDCIIAMYNGRFTAVMSAIISEALKRGVRVLVVYTKMDVEVHNERNNWFEPMSAEVAETALRERVRDNVAAEVQRLRSAADPSEVSTSASAVPLFFIDSILMVQGKWRFDEKALKLEVVRCFAPRLGGAMTAEELWAHVTAIAGEDAAEWQVPREE
jgi:predicted GTPase